MIEELNNHLTQQTKDIVDQFLRGISVVDYLTLTSECDLCTVLLRHDLGLARAEEYIKVIISPAYYIHLKRINKEI